MRTAIDAIVGSPACAKLSKTEPGTIGYEWFSADDRAMHVFERFKDSAAVLAHLGAMMPFVEQLLATCDMKQLVVYGDANADVTKALGGFGATFEKQMLGFNRF